MMLTTGEFTPGHCAVTVGNEGVCGAATGPFKLAVGVFMKLPPFATVVLEICWPTVKVGVMLQLPLMLIWWEPLL